MSPSTAPGSGRIELPITGMTCASCAARIEKRLNRLDGVEASVNYATETAAVDFDPAAVAPERLVEAIEQVGYGARLPDAGAAAEEDAEPDESAGLRHRLIASAVLSLPVLLMSMVPAAAVRQLAVAGADARHPGRALGRLALPPRGLDEPAPRRRHDGHPDLDRDARRVAAGRSSRCSSWAPAIPA